MFLTIKFKEKKPELHSWIFFLSAMIKNIKICNFLILLGFQNLWNLINVFIKRNLWKCSLKSFLWFFKIRWVEKNQGVMFLVVPPKDGLAYKSYLLHIPTTPLPFALLHFESSNICLDWTPHKTPPQTLISNFTTTKMKIGKIISIFGAFFLLLLSLKHHT